MRRVAPQPSFSAYNGGTDHGGPDPIQGYDVEIWVQRPDLVTSVYNLYNGRDMFDTNRTMGGMILLGQFTGIAVTIRTTVESYMEYDSRTPVYMDGEVQIQWRLEKGLVNMDVFKETFGTLLLGRRVSYNLLPRFNITFNVNTISYDQEQQAYVPELNQRVDYAADGLPGPGGTYSKGLQFSRKANGRFVLKNCKLDTFHLEATAGKQVVANSWSGVADEIVSLAGDPPQMSRVDPTGSIDARLDGNYVDAKKSVYGALDTAPAYRSDTRLPAADIKDKALRAQQKADALAIRSGLGSLLGPTLGDLGIDVNPYSGQADTTLPTGNIQASSSKTQAAVTQALAGQTAAESAMGPYPNTELPRTAIITGTAASNATAFVNAFGQQLVQGLGQWAIDAISLGNIANANLPPDQMQQVLSRLPQDVRDRAVSAGILKGSVSERQGR